MHLWETLTIIALVGLAVSQGKNGPIGWEQWEKTPSGGPSTVLRKCAEYAYWDSRGELPSGFTGCKDTECVCRPDLISKIHEKLTALVERECGKDSKVDVDRAIKIYNDYCSWMGWPIPGYTYIVTQTVLPLEETSATATVTTETPDSSNTPISTKVIVRTDTLIVTEEIITGSANNGTPAPTLNIPPVVTETARVTIIASSSSALRLRASPWLQTLIHLISEPVNFILGDQSSASVP